jgi:hypothetical protein
VNGRYPGWSETNHSSPLSGGIATLPDVGPMHGGHEHPPPGSSGRYPLSRSGGQATEPIGVTILGSLSASERGAMKVRAASLATPSSPESSGWIGARPRG